MPIFLLLVGTLLIVVAINDKLPELQSLIAGDLRKSSSGQAGFGVWIVAIFAVGAIGYAKPLRPFANSFLVLIVLVMLLSNKGFFANFTKAVERA